MGCLPVPVLLRDIEQLPDGGFLENFCALNDRASRGERHASAIDNIHQIDDFNHEAITEDGHAYDKPNHGFEWKLAFTQCDVISERQFLSDKVSRNEIGKAENLAQER